MLYTELTGVKGTILHKLHIPGRGMDFQVGGIQP